MITRICDGSIDKIGWQDSRRYRGSVRGFLADVAVADKKRVGITTDRGTFTGGDNDFVVRIGKIENVSGAVETGVFDYPIV